MRLAGDPPTILLPIDNLYSELDSALVTATALSAHGCRAIAGYRDAIAEIESQSRHALWFGKGGLEARSLAPRVASRTARESAIMLTPSVCPIENVHSWGEQLSQEKWAARLENCHADRICVLGEQQSEDISQLLPGSQRSIVVTGSARFDLCLPSFSWVTDGAEAAPPIPEGPFVLACPRFAAITDARGMSAPFATDQYKDLSSDTGCVEEIDSLWLKNWRRTAHDLAEFTILIKEIAASLPHLTIVIRPHSLEKPEFYQNAFSTHENVRIEQDGDVLRWIRAAALVVHSGSINGIEAVLAGRPVLNYLPSCYGDRETDMDVAREAGIVATSLASALEAVDRLLLAKEVEMPQWSAKAIHTLSNLKAAAIPLLTEAALSVLETTGIEASSIVVPKGRGLKRFMKKLAGGHNNRALASQRPPLCSSHIERLLEGCRTHQAGSGRLSHITEDYAVIEPQ